MLGVFFNDTLFQGCLPTSNHLTNICGLIGPQAILSWTGMTALRSFVLDVCFSLDVGRSMFNVRRSSFKIIGYLLNYA
jgi:hypothetical protein